MSPNPIVAMAPINVQTTAVQGSTNSNTNQQKRQQTRQNMQVNGSPRHRKNRNQRDRNTPSPKQRGSPKPKTSIPSSSRRNYTPPPRFQKMGQFDGANNNNSASSSNFSDSQTSSDDNSDSTKENYAGAKFHSEAPGAETLPMPPSSWLVGCSNQAAVVSNPNPGPHDYHELANELKCMLKVAL